MTAKELQDGDAALRTAERVAAVLLKKDAFSALLGMRLVTIEPGRAIVELCITEQHLNGLGICHGGVTFSLADTAFAYACNSRNQKTVALNCNIAFTRRAQTGETLRAIACEQHVTGETGVYDITVTNNRDEVVALFRGTSFRLDQPSVPE